MWCCCCPRKEEEDESPNKSLKEDLVSKVRKSQPQIEVTNSHYEECKQQIDEPSPSKQPQLLNPLLQKMRQIEVQHEPVKMQVLDQIPKEEPRGPVRSVLKSGASEEGEKTKKRSQLWLQESGSKILYMNSQKDEQMVFTFKINKIKLDENHPMNFILQPVRYRNPTHSITKIKPAQFMVCLIISTKSLTKLQTSITKIANECHVKPIFGLLKKDDEQKLSKSYFQSEIIHEIILLGKGCLRLQSIDKIIISLRDEKDFHTILSYCQKITQQFELQDLAKITFIFPSFLTLSEICLILSKLFRKFIISEKLERIVKYLGYHIEMVETITQQFEEILIVSANTNIETDSQKQFQIKLQLALGMLMIEVDYHTFKIYSNLILNFLADKTITDYLKFIQFVHKDRDKKQFISTLQSLKLFDQAQMVEIANANRLQQKFISPSEKMIVIKHRNKKRISDLFSEYRATETPDEQFDKKKEWDDDLKEQEIKATIMDRNVGINQKSKHAENNYNIFEVIDEDFVEKTDLQLEANEEELQFQEDQI